MIQKCPVCNGKGIVPNGFYFVPEGQSFVASGNILETCRACNGRGIILMDLKGQKEMSELKPCRFCGSPLELTEKGSSIGPVNKKPYWEFTDVDCTNEKCPFSMMFDSKEYTKSQIIEFLNNGLKNEKIKRGEK